MDSKFMLLGYTPGQWWTVFSNYPPDPMDFRGVTNSRMLWQKNKPFPPPDAQVTQKFLRHWEKFCKTLKLTFGREP